MTDHRTLYQWRIKRAGNTMTIKHSTGKVTNVASIHVEAGAVIASTKGGTGYLLYVSPIQSDN